MEFLTKLLTSIIKPIISDEIKSLKEHISHQYRRNELYEKYDKQVIETIKLAENASTPEEVWAHLRRLKSQRAKLDI